MKKTLAKQVSVLFVFALLCVALAGCYYEVTPTTGGIYNIHTVELIPNKLDIVNFENQRGRPLEFRFGEADFVTVSFIFFNDPENDRTYHAQYSSGPTTYETFGNRIVIDIDFDYVGAIDIRIYDGWIILNYTIQNQLVYSARYRKTA